MPKRRSGCVSCTSSVDRAKPVPQRSVSLLGLREGAAAQGELDQASATIDLLFVAAGLLLGSGGWYAYFASLPSYIH
jgi:hypothetical protein